MPVRGSVSTPTSPAAVTAAPSVPGTPDAKVQAKANGGTLVAPALATISWLGPRCGPCPRFTAACTACQNAAPVPGMLSNTSTRAPGMVTVSFQHPALPAADSATPI